MRRAALLVFFSYLGAACHGRSHQAATVTVTIRAMKFDPATVAVQAGDTLVFDNQDLVAHTATGRGFDSGPLQPRQTWHLTVERPGDLPYRCSLHPTMTGTIIVR